MKNEQMDIFELNTYYDVNLEDLSDELKQKLHDDGLDFDDEDEIIVVSGGEINYYEIPYDAINYSSGELDTYALETDLECYLGRTYPHYLVFASGCRWNGASGYKFCENLLDIVSRPYDICFYIDLSDTEEGKFKARESSHDVPMGSTTYVIGLSEKEYEELRESNFEAVEAFVKSKFGE